MSGRHRPSGAPGVMLVGMDPSLPDASGLARMQLAQQHPMTRDWVDDASRLAHLADEHAFDVQLASNLDLAARRAAFLDVGQPLGAFLNRWVAVGPDLSAMLSVRFEGLDRAKPFVDVLTSRAWDAADLDGLAGAALAAFGRFQPLYLRLWSPRAAGYVAGTWPDKRVLAAPVPELRGRYVPPELTLTPTTDARHLPDATAAYAAVDARHPAHPDQAAVLSQEDLLECIEAGTMFDVRLGGGWAGYAGVLPEVKLGLEAYTIQELILTPQARGQGYGPALTTLLAQALPDAGRVLLGTVHAENQGARAAALAAGRHDVGGWVRRPLRTP